MGRTYSKHFSTKSTPQTEAIPGRELEMTPNNAGGVGFEVSPATQLTRFLILGAEGGTFYVSEHKLSQDNAKNLVSMLKDDGLGAVEIIRSVTVAGRAPKKEPAIFALALAASLGNDETRAAALAAVNDVCTIPTDLFMFAGYLQDFGGWGRGKRTAIANWYNQRDLEKLAYQVVKYRNRNGWSHRDLLRLAHPATAELARNSLYRWIAKEGEVNATDLKRLPAIVRAFLEAQKTTDVRKLGKLIDEYNLTWEMIPTEALAKPAIWPKLLAKMPMNAMIRMLNRMTANGTLTPLGEHTDFVVAKLENSDLVRKSKIHPIKIVSAMKTYASGHGKKGDLTWTPVPQIQAALENAFYSSFGGLEPTGKRFLLGLDVSGSMASNVLGMDDLSCAEGTALMSMVTARVEKKSHIFGFAGTFKNLGVNSKDTLESAFRKVRSNNFGTTDCALPMTWARQHNVPVDMFCVYTDNETYGGSSHPSQELRNYRKETGIPAKLVVVGMAASDVSIADPKDAGMMDVVGFDTAVPGLIEDFARN